MFHRLANWLSLTRAEQRVILFLSATLLIGAGIRFYQEAYPPTRQFDYRSADSTFAAFRDQLGSDTLQKKTGTTGLLLDINSASKDELVGLPGIGMTLAERIVLFRENEGGFASIEDLQKVKGISKKKLEKLIPNTMVMQEMSKPRETRILGRGDYRNQGEVVTAGVPAVLPPLPKGAPLNRLGLAQWLVDHSHPLTARVAVNRYWQLCFGTGLVKTSEDFGSQGEPPSHPELLDWLATEFVRTHWDVKAMMRLIVTSETYRQASRATPALIERDPENRLLARGPRSRLPAEIVRDNALAVSGLLNPSVGGPSVFPYQPAGLWEEMAFGEGFTAQEYTPSHGADLYRRSMYTFWKRTVPPPSLSTFDAPDREKCVARRAVTNTPLQALVLLNDPTYVEAARWLAQRVISEAGLAPSQRIRLVFRLATGRAPTLRETQILAGLERSEILHYRQDRDAAMKLLAVGESPASSKADPSELAAWTTVANAILNLDETITKE